MPPAIPTEILDPDGDATLVVREDGSQASKRFVVSSKNLILASPYFKKLFSPAFREGASRTPGESNHTEINLQDDSVEAMSIILALLHFKHQDSFYFVKGKTLVDVAKHCDKYQCNTPLSSWIRWWIRGPQAPCSSPEDYGWLFTAALIFQSHEDMQALSAEVIRNLNPDFGTQWAEFEEMQVIPEGIVQRAMIDQMQRKISRVKARIEEQITEQGLALRKNVRIWPYRKDPFCGCARNHCGTCKEKMPYKMDCNTHVRFSEYFDFFNKKDLWPEVDCNLGLSDIRDMLNEAIVKPFHACEVDAKCTLRVRIANVASFLEQQLKGINGLSKSEIKAVLK